MSEIAEIILTSGRAGVELALFVLLPIMVVMLSTMRLLESWGILDRLAKLAAPLLKPLGLPGLGVFAMIQVLFVSFAAPMATLAIMDRGGTPRRQIAATLALVLGMAQANVTYPMAAFGLDAVRTLSFSLVGGLIGAALTYHLFARSLPEREDSNDLEVPHKSAEDVKGVLAVINRAGAEALRVATGSLPLLILALVVVNTMRSTGAMDGLVTLLAPVLGLVAIPEAFIMPIITKYIAGGTAMMAVTLDLVEEGLVTMDQVNKMAGLLISPYDVAGIAIIISAGPRVAQVLRPALLGGAAAILVRSLLHALV
ncbi:MAG: nucleoside recognition domain-containing protein [Rhodospirillaceae bacterium]